MQNDVEEDTRTGVTSIPAFCINGRLVSGAQHLESFVRVIAEVPAHSHHYPLAWQMNVYHEGNQATAEGCSAGDDWGSWSN